ncbi:MAG: C25 family cysteine peptidase [Bacteroidetes bacterium]|nr:C25 family cysteine peptidase [Bacteroidota bacterium]
MKKEHILLIILSCFVISFTYGGKIEKDYFFSDYKINSSGTYQTIIFPNTILSGIPGEPVLPYAQVFLMVPPGEVAESIDVFGEKETIIPGFFILSPGQEMRPVSDNQSGKFLKNEKIYTRHASYPSTQHGRLLTQYLNGYGFAISTITPLKYNPVSGKVSFFRKIIVRIHTRKSGQHGNFPDNISSLPDIQKRIRQFSQNPEMISHYPHPQFPVVSYQLLIIAPALFQNEFQPLLTMYNNKGISGQVKTVESISSVVSGYDLQEKIRNYIIDQYQNDGIQYVLLAGNPQFIPCRGFYCHVISGGGYDDWNIPGDLYYSGLNGNYDSNGNHVYGEVNDNPDLLPDIGVARMPVNDTAELHHMISKSVSYQTNPVLGELKNPFLIGEHLWDAPATEGGPYMNLLVDTHTDYGYYTHGIPSATNTIEKLFDSVITPGNIWHWSVATLIAKINTGKTFLHHLGHANTNYVMRLYTSDITDLNFSQVNGYIHNYQLLYTQGCYCGAFDQSDCIASKMLTIHNFLVGGVFNSRYGWFDEGTTDGPSEHLQREFVSALYNDTIPERHFGTVHMISKIKTAPWVTLPGEWEPGAQRWCHYCSNALGDPAMEIWTDEPSFFSTVTWTGAIDTEWGKAGNWTPPAVPTSLNNVVLPNTLRKPVITTSNLNVCHDLIIQEGTFTINPGKSIIVRGNIILDQVK